MVGRQGKNAIIAGCLKALGWRREYPELRQLPVPGETHESPDRPTPTTVRLAKLKLAGFKTFVDPTTVLTPGNLVGVVGPNGCGKSNIIDAVRWVLGETRASALRGESMQDVIFNGSTTRKPVSRASVELVFDNAQGKAAGQWSQYAEIAVKRVLDRSGESTYYINNVHVRRKDVIDLFLGTGLGPRAYAIIEQGMISRIIEAKPEEIRHFLEEAAGVTKYRERRRETEGRLVDARDNLARLDDIRAELGGRIVHLAAQAEMAERYRALHDAHAERQNLLWLIKRNEARDERQRVSDALNEATRQIESDSARLHELEQLVERAREAHFAASETVHVAQSDLFSVTAEVSRLEAERQHLQDTRKRLEARLLQLETDERHWASRSGELREEAERWAGLHEHAGLRVAQAEARHEEAAGRLPEVEEALRQAEAGANAARRELAQTEQQLRVEETQLNSARRALDAFAVRRTRIEQEAGAIVGPDPATLAEREARLVGVEELVEVLGARQLELQVAFPAAQQELRQALDEERKAQRHSTELRARHDALVQLQNKIQNQGQLAEWLGRHGLDRLSPLWRELSVEPGWELALEAVLRERLSAVRPEGLPALLEALEDPAPSSFAFVLEPHASRIERIPAPAGASPLEELVRSGSEGVRQSMGGWLAGVFAVDDIAPWLEKRESLSRQTIIVSRKGQLLAADTLTQYAPDARTHGVMERQREIEVLADELQRSGIAAEQAHGRVVEADGAATRIQEQLNELRRELQARQQELHGEQVEVLKLGQAMQRASERRGQLEHDLADLLRSEEAERELLARAQIELERCAELAELQRSRLDSALNLARDHEQRLREARSVESAVARELQEARFAERECVGKLEDIARNRALAEEQVLKLRDEFLARQAELEASDGRASDEALQQALGLRESREAALAACRDALSAAAEQLRGQESMRLRTEQSVAPMRDKVAELRLKVQACELAEAQHQERLTEAGADEHALAPLVSAELKETSLQREVARLAREIADLGAVNLAALDELKSAEQRKAYLDAQYDDLMQAIETLEDAIRRIDRETREQLQQTYDTVNRQFGSLFPQLFGGGEAKLVLTGDEILDAGVQIVAQPPGKKNSSIHLLSGGEKALTAIALVFSMFQLNPAPFCMLDEVDAPLDDTNTERYGSMVKRMSSQTQFIFISHSKITMEIAQQLVGVTMQEQGVSRVVEVDIDEAMRLAEPVAA